MKCSHSAQTRWDIYCWDVLSFKMYLFCTALCTVLLLLWTFNVLLFVYFSYLYPISCRQYIKKRCVWCAGVSLTIHSLIKREAGLVVSIASNIWRSDGPEQPIFAVRQANIFKRLVHRTTIIFCPSGSIYLKANTLLGTGLTVIQSQPSWSCLPVWHAWCLYHVYWSKTRKM